MAASQDRQAVCGLGLFERLSERADEDEWADHLQKYFEYALAEGDMCLSEKLLQAGVKVGPGYEGRYGRTMLHAAAEGGSVDAIKMLLSKQHGGKADLDTKSGDEGTTALMLAIEAGHSAVSQELILAGADVNVEDKYARCALYYALSAGLVDVAGDLLVAGSSVTTACGEVMTEADYEDVHLFRKLILKGLDVNDATNTTYSYPMLHGTVSGSVLQIGYLTVLLDAGVDPNMKNQDGETPLQMVLYCSGDWAEDATQVTWDLLEEVVSLLLKHGADVNTKGFTPLHHAVEIDNPAAMRAIMHALIDAGADMEAPLGNTRAYCKDMTPISLALLSARPRFAAVDVLLDRGAKINGRDKRGRTPLIMLCQRWWATCEKVAFLLRRGADETMTNKRGKTPLDLVTGDKENDKAIRTMLANAPKDRRWWRRSWLVMLRTRFAAGAGNIGGGSFKAPKVGRCEQAGFREVVVSLVGLEADALFRNVVSFL